MLKIVIQVVVLIAIPVAAFLLGGWLMSQISDRGQLLEILSKAPAPDRKPLGERLSYDVEAVKRQWDKLGSRGREIWRHMLQLDLLFPGLYGGALIFSLAMAWWMVGRPYSFFWIGVLPLGAMLADYTENLIQLNQLQKFDRFGASSLDAHWIRVASIATLLKFSFITISSLLLLTLGAIILARGLSSAHVRS